MEHRIALAWRKGDKPFTYDGYDRNHEIVFKQGVRLVASGAAAFKGDASKADPEDLFVAALSSCHALTFLSLAAKKRLSVQSYEDLAVGFLENDAAAGHGGRLWMTRVILRPKVVFESDPGAEILAQLHHQAHAACFIANSVKTEVTVEPR